MPRRGPAALGAAVALAMALVAVLPDAAAAQTRRLPEAAQAPLPHRSAPAPSLPFYDAAILDVCLQQRAGADGADCIGLAAARCQHEEGGASTLGSSHCLRSEWEDWDQRLNAAYGRLLRQVRAQDADRRRTDRTGPARAELLIAAQRAWIAYRDATCAFEASAYHGGSLQGPTNIACMLDLTGRQALFLDGQADES